MHTYTTELICMNMHIRPIELTDMNMHICTIELTCMNKHTCKIEHTHTHTHHLYHTEILKEEMREREEKIVRTIVLPNFTFLRYF